MRNDAMIGHDVMGGALGWVDRFTEKEEKAFGRGRLVVFRVVARYLTLLDWFGIGSHSICYHRTLRPRD